AAVDVHLEDRPLLGQVARHVAEPVDVGERRLHLLGGRGQQARVVAGDGDGHVGARAGGVDGRDPRLADVGQVGEPALEVGLDRVPVVLVADGRGDRGVVRPARADGGQV
ncbi:MAG: hypothetical protein AVDCRST_MAG48-535, partial [uncultured Friedmanniella sp.]